MARSGRRMTNEKHGLDIQRLLWLRIKNRNQDGVTGVLAFSHFDILNCTAGLEKVLGLNTFNSQDIRVIIFDHLIQKSEMSD